MTKLKSCDVQKVVYDTGPNADSGLTLRLTNDRDESLEFTLTKEEVVDFTLKLIVSADVKEELVRQLDILAKMSGSLPKST